MAPDIFDLDDPTLISFNSLPPSSPVHDGLDDFAPSSPTPAGPRPPLPKLIPSPPVIHFLGLPRTPHFLDRATSVPLPSTSSDPPSPTPYRALSLPAPSSPPSSPIPLSFLRGETTPLATLGSPSTPVHTPRPNRHRANSLPVAPSSGATSFVHTSSPWTKVTRAAKSRAAGQRKRRETLKRRRIERGDSSESESDCDELEELTPMQQAKLDEILKRTVKELDKEELDVGDLVQYIFNPVSGLRERLWKSFFRARGRATSILNWWISSSTSKTGRVEVHNWAVEYVAGVVSKEAEAITQSGYMRSQDIGEEVATFSFSKLYEDFKTKHAVVTTRIFEAAAYSARQIRDGISSTRLLKKQTLVATSIAACLSEYSQKNNIVKRIFGMFLYATGVQRQVLTTLSHVGYAESYTNLTAKAGVGGRKSSGPLEDFSEGQRTSARAEALNPEIGEVYDNLNSTKKVVEQVMGRTAIVESGTASTIFPLHKADREDMKLDEFELAFDAALPLSQHDVLLTASERLFLRRQLTYCVLRIVVNHGPGFADRYQSMLTKTQPATPQRILPHRTHLYPLPTWKIDESTIIGNAEVDEAVVEELRLRNQPTNWMKYVRIIAGDQLSIARLRALASVRAGNEGGYRGFGWGVWMPGLFHAKIADMHGFFATHFGKPNTGTRNPGSLSFHNTLLHRLPISPTSLPNFRTCRDLVFVSLYARVLACLLEVSGHGSLEEYLQKVKKWDTLHKHAEEIVDRFANANIVDGLRDERELDGTKGGDMVFENAVLFLRDALLSREFTDAVKAGDSGRVLLILKTWALSFRGNGRTKYAYEMLTLIHNLTKVWPKKIADIVLNNWLLNPTGNPNSFVEVDLVQEHMNFWIKTFYKAHGANASWSWLEMISPCVHALRRLVTNMKKVLGTDIGSRHKPVDVSTDVRVLLDSLREHRVHTVVPGRKVDSDTAPVPDVIAEGYKNLVEGQALREYNEIFLKSQRQRRVRPLVTDDLETTITTTAQTTSASPPPVTINVMGNQEPGAIDMTTPTESDLGEEGDEGDDVEMGDDTGAGELDVTLDMPEETLAIDTFGDVELDMDSQEVEEEEEEEDGED